jgi:DNA-directed RNA polymerase subunit omega
MARVTVEDCIEEIPNRFELVVLTSERARNISSGAPLTVERNNDKNPVIALREIAAGNIDIEKLRDSQIANLQKNNKLDDITDENLYAENQESVVLEADYADSLEDASFSPEEEIGFEADIDFSDDIDTTEEDK